MDKPSTRQATQQTSESAVHWARLQCGDRQASLVVYGQQYARVLEGQALKVPLQWNNFIGSGRVRMNNRECALSLRWTNRVEEQVL